MEQTPIQVSVLVMTYNHVDFITQALDSVLAQKTTFTIEILISEDYSTDGTRERVLQYKSRFPDKIRLLLSDNNIHSNAVVARGIKAAKGKYIALLDGDDYWTSTHKIQDQVDFLESHSDCSICFHNAELVDEKNKFLRYWTKDQKSITTLEDLWFGNYIATCSTMFRNHLIGDLPAWYDDFFPITDWPLHILNAEHGNIGYIDKSMGAYRYHRGGMYSPLAETEKLKKMLDFYQRMNTNLNFKYDRLVRIALSKYFFEWTQEYLNRGDLKNAKLNYARYLSGRPVTKFTTLFQCIKMGLKLHIFPLVRAYKPRTE